MNKELKRIFSEKKASSKGYHLLKYDNVSLDRWRFVFVEAAIRQCKKEIIFLLYRKYTKNHELIIRSFLTFFFFFYSCVLPICICSRYKLISFFPFFFFSKKISHVHTLFAILSVDFFMIKIKRLHLDWSAIKP